MPDIAGKKAMIQWILDFYPHENREVNNFLIYLIKNEELLKYIEFTDQVIFAPRGLWIDYTSKFSQ